MSTHLKLIFIKKQMLDTDKCLRLLFSWHSCRHIWQLLQYDGNSYLLFSTISYHFESSSKYSIHLLWFCDDKNFFDFFAVFFAQNYCSYILEKNGDRHCLANYFCHAKWCWRRAEQMAQVIWCWQESAAPAKEYFFVKLTFAELSFCDGPGEENS